MRTIDNMILCLRCADEAVRTAIIDPDNERYPGMVGIDTAKFDVAIKPLAITMAGLIDKEGLIIIIMDELDYHDGRPTECLAFRIAHRLYHEAFDVRPEVSDA